MICMMCGVGTMGAMLCDHHILAVTDGWAESNRLWCNWLHRHEEPPPAPVVSFVAGADLAEFHPVETYFSVEA